MPPGLPGVTAPDVGDFLGLLANGRSNAIAEDLLALAATYVPQFPVLASTDGVIRPPKWRAV